MILSSVALKYARALADVAFEQNLQGQILEQLYTFENLLTENPELPEALTNPAILFSSKRAIVEQIAERVAFSRIVANFILVLLEKARIHQFSQMVMAYQRVMDERQGILQGEVFAPEEVDSAVKKRLHETISALTGSTVKLNYHQDESLIGGLKLQIGSTVFDGSIRTQLDEIRKRLATE